MPMRRRARWGIRTGVVLALCAPFELVIGWLTGVPVPVSLVLGVPLSLFCYYFVARRDGFFGDLKMFPWILRNTPGWAQSLWFLTFIALVLAMPVTHQTEIPFALLPALGLYFAVTNVMTCWARLRESDAV
ncbi:hypothetical protein ACIBSW_09960 [Actinoplanes sp. NPDC049668]|uniref:hypothetical protein n=1 Tax=unclassified Actinoplanes TaxID=2626549 RepID=UPI0033B54DB6